MSNRAFLEAACQQPAMLSGLTEETLDECGRGLKPVAQAWADQYGSARALEVRLTQAGAVHDRLVIVSDRDV